MSIKKIVVLASGNGSNLQAIIDWQQQGKIDARIVEVITNRPQAYALVRAQQAGISTQVFDHHQFDDRDHFDQALGQRLAQLQPDWVILAGFMRVLGPILVNQFQNKIINIHPSLLPKYPGLQTHQRVIDAQDRYHGSSIHVVIPQLDAGPIILHSMIEVSDNDTKESLQVKVQQQEYIIYPQTIAWLCNERIRLTPQGFYFDKQIIPHSGLNYAQLCQ